MHVRRFNAWRRLSTRRVALLWLKRGAIPQIAITAGSAPSRAAPS